MTETAERLLHQAMSLTAEERTALVEGLVESLDKPDPTLDQQWLREAEDRIAAYRAGHLQAVDANQAFSDLGQKI